MAEPDGNGTRLDSLNRQLERAEKKSDAKRVAEFSEALALPLFPRALSYLWQAYIRLRRRAQSGFSGAQPIGWQDIDAFVQRTGLDLAPWEIRVIERLDDIYLRPEPNPSAAAAAHDGVGVKSILGSVGKRRVVKRKQKGADQWPTSPP